MNFSMKMVHLLQVLATHTISTKATQNGTNGAVASVGVVTKVVPFVLVGTRRLSLVFQCLESIGNSLTSVPGAVLAGVVVAPKTPKWTKRSCCKCWSGNKSCSICCDGHKET